LFSYRKCVFLLNTWLIASFIWLVLPMTALGLPW